MLVLLLLPTAAAPQDPGALAQASRDLIASAREYRASLERLLPFNEADLARATEALEKRRALLERGIVARRDVEEAERAQDTARAKLELTRGQLGQADTLIAEALAAEELRRHPPTPGHRDGGTAETLFTYFDGHGAWSLTDAGKIERFFQARFGRPLPVSALGQTSVHDRLGFDHKNALDVAVHPDSPEGRALIAYLRTASISYLAFRSAVPGAATGAHIHIGPASHRLAQATPVRR